MRSLMQSRLGRAMAVLAALVFIWRAGYGVGHNGMFDARHSWNLYKQFSSASLLERFFNQYLWLALIETAIIMAGIVALAYAVRWVMRAR